MRFDSVRLPLAGALLLAAAGLTFAWGTDPNGAASEPIAATQSTAAAMLAVRDAPLAAVTAVPHPAVLHSAVRHAAPKHAARVHAAPVHAAVVRMKPIHRAAGHAPAVHAALVRGKAVHVGCVQQSWRRDDR